MEMVEVLTKSTIELQETKFEVEEPSRGKTETIVSYTQFPDLNRARYFNNEHIKFEVVDKILQRKAELKAIKIQCELRTKKLLNLTQTDSISGYYCL